MKGRYSITVVLLTLLSLSLLCVSQNFDFFYFVQQWPVSYCDTKRSCCYPTTGKPASNFSIHGLWPNYNNGSYPHDCNRKDAYNENQISDLIPRMQTYWPTIACPSNNGSKFWAHEWSKHGTCAEPIFNQHDYFEAALNIKNSVDLLQILIDAGMKPGGFYDVKDIKKAIKDGVGHEAVVECNRDAMGNSQLFQVYLCVDTFAVDIIECPLVPKRKCNSTVEFPDFGPSSPHFVELSNM